MYPFFHPLQYHGKRGIGIVMFYNRIAVQIYLSRMADTLEAKADVSLQKGLIFVAAHTSIVFQSRIGLKTAGNNYLPCILLCAFLIKIP